MASAYKPRRRSKAVLFLSLGAFVLPAFTQPAESGWDYSKLGHKLREGDKPLVVIDLSKCKDSTGVRGPTVVAVPSFSTYNVTQKFIATSDTQVFEDASGAMLLQYARLRIFPDNGAELFLKRLNPTTYEPVGPSTTLRCRLNDGSLTLNDGTLANSA